jgi:hydrophobe/amphiphile efflux-1 (HAE1) family protein
MKRTSLADISINRPVFAWMIMTAMIVFGAIGFMRLGVSQMPDIDFPILNISLTYEGASPAVIEADLVDPIESRVISVEGVKEIRSTIRQGSASVKMEFEINRNIDSALQEVQAAISRLKLPPQVDPPVIKKSNPEDDPIMIIGLQATKGLREAIRFSDLVLLDQFQTIEGVGEVDVNGFSTRNLRIFVDNVKLKKNLLTVLDVATAIQQGHSELAAGYIEDAKKATNVRAMGEGLNPEDIGDLWIRNRGGELIREPILRVKDVATVVDSLSDVRRLARVNGVDGLALGIRKQRGSNEVEVAKAVYKKVDELNKKLPDGYKLQINADYSKATQQIVETTTHKLLMAAIVTAIICFLFLGTWSSVINVLLSIPTSILGTFVVLYFADFTLNLFTLLALALAISIVVDDAIMMLENIMRHFKMGKPRKVAASDGAAEIWMAALAATIAVVAIFLPVVFMRGIIGKFFFQFGVTISTAVLLSLLEAVTLTPMRCAALMRRGDDDNWLTRRTSRWFHALEKGYRASLAVALRWKWSTLTVSTALFVLSIFLFTILRKEFVPMSDQNLVFFSIQTPPGSSLSETDSKVRLVEAWVKAQKEVDRYYVSVGSSSAQAAVNNGFIGVTLVPKDQRHISHVQFMQRARERFKGIKGLSLKARDASSRGLTAGRSYPIAFNIRGPNYETLKRLSEDIQTKLAATGLVSDLDTDYKEGQPELRLTPLRAQSAQFGVNMEAIAQTVSAAVGGLRQGQFTNDGRRYDIRISLSPDERMTKEQVAQLQVRNYAQQLVPLTRLVDMNVVSTVQSITRINRSRSISVFGNLVPGVSQGDALKKAEEIAAQVLPVGYSFNLEGAAQTFDESFGSLYFALALGVLVAYMVLASQFNSFLQPVAILLALPFSISGAFVALWGFNQSLNLYSMIGILLLMGIAKKNSILLVEFTNKVREGEAVGEEGMSQEHQGKKIEDINVAQLIACPVRLRPILMTSVATIAAATPLAIDSGPGSETRIPMGLAIIGGTLVSTLFTLYVVPAAYSILARFDRASEDPELASYESARSSESTI